MFTTKDPLQFFIAFILTIIAIFGVANYLQDSQYYSMLASSNSFLAQLPTGSIIPSPTPIPSPRPSLLPSPTPGSSVIPPLFCAPSSQTVNSGEAVTVRGAGGPSGAIYFWEAPFGIPEQFWASSFTTTFTNNGTTPVLKTITLTANGNTVNCTVTVNPRIISSVSPNPSPVSVTPKSCFICGYLDLPQCSEIVESAAYPNLYGNLTSAQKCNTLTPAGGNEGDCTWINNTCQNRFKVNCNNKLKEMGDNYDWATSIPYDTPINRDYPSDCTQRDYYYSGHSDSFHCPEFFNSVQACITGMAQAFPTGTPLDLNFTNDGCRTFANQAEVEASVQNIQNNLPSGFRVSVTGNQAVSANFCRSHMTIVITPNRTQSTYGPCHVGVEGTINHCFVSNEQIRCTNNNQIVNEICCATREYYDSGSTVNQWFSGTICTTSSCPTRATYDTLLASAQTSFNNCTRSTCVTATMADQCINNYNRDVNLVGRQCSTSFRPSYFRYSWQYNPSDSIFTKLFGTRCVIITENSSYTLPPFGG